MPRARRFIAQLYGPVIVGIGAVTLIDTRQRAGTSSVQLPTGGLTGGEPLQMPDCGGPMPRLLGTFGELAMPGQQPFRLGGRLMVLLAMRLNGAPGPAQSA